MYSFKNPESESDLTSKTSSDSQDSSLRSRSRNSISLKSCEPLKIMLETTLSMKNLLQDIKKLEPENTNPETGHAESTNFVPQPVVYFSPRPISELNDAATRIQKVYKSYRTRRNLADAAAFVEELWLKTLEFAALDRSSVNGVEVVQQ